MDRNLRIRMLLEAGDRVSKPLREIAGGSTRAAQALKATRDRLKEVERAQASIAGFRQLKTGLKTTSADLQAAEGRVAALARKMAEAGAPTKKLAADFTRAKRDASALRTTFEQQSIELQKIRDRMAAAGVSTSGLAGHERRLRQEAARTNAELSQQERRLRASADRASRFGAARDKFGKMQGTATGLAAGGGASIGTGIAIGTPLVAVAREAINLEDVMADVRKVVNFETPKQFDEMREKIVNLSTVLPRTAEEIGQIVAAGGRSGLGRADLLGFAEDATKMSVAFDMSAEDAGAMMATWRTAFGVGREGVQTLGDKVNALTNKFGGNVQVVNAIVTRIGPLGKVAGLASGQIAGLAQMMAKLGLEEEVGATGIKNMMLALSRGAATTPHAAAAFKQLGLDATEVARRMQKDAGGTILDVFHRLDKLNAADRPGVLTRLFGRESIAAIAPLLTALPQLEANFALVGDKTRYAGSMQAEYVSRSNTTSNAVRLAQNNFNALFITIGTSLLPTITSLANKTGHVLNRMRAWSRAHPTLSKGIAIVAGVAAVLLVLLGGLSFAAAAVIAPLAALTTIATFFGVSLGAILWPILAVIAAVGLLAGGAYLIYANWGAITGFFAGIWKYISTAFHGGIAGITGLLVNFSPVGLLYAGFAALLRWLGVDIPASLSTVGANIIHGLVSGIKGALKFLYDAVTGAASSAAKWFKEKLGIHSPSRVFMGFGGHIMTGLANGIAGGEDGPVRRIDNLSRRLTSAMAVGAALPALAAPAFAQPAGHSPAGGGGGAAGARHYEIHVHPAPGMDERKLADLVARKIDEADRGKSAARRASFADDPDWSHSA
jgi:TP901 family phage tail tape measure protein